MEENEAVRSLMTRLMEAVEASLSSSTAVRDALAELVRNGYEARLFFVANAESESASGPDDDADDPTAPDDDEPSMLHEIGALAEDREPSLELTKLDRDFLRSLNIRPETD